MAELAAYLPSIGALRAVEAAARNLSFTLAAADLNLTQGAVSHQIRELEGRLGVALFARQARGIALTEAGCRYLPHVHEALRQLRLGAQALSGRDTILTVSVSPNFASKWLVPKLGVFLAAHPDMELRLSAAARHVDFADGEIDVAIRHGDGHWPQLHVSRLCRETIFPVCSPFLDGADDVQQISDLVPFVLIHDQSREGWGHWLKQAGADVSPFDLAAGPIYSQTSLAIDAAIAGQGIALARSALAQADLIAGRIVRPVADEIPASFAYWIVCPKGMAERRPITRFRNWLQSEARQDTKTAGRRSVDRAKRS